MNHKIRRKYIMFILFHLIFYYYKIISIKSLDVFQTYYH